MPSKSSKLDWNELEYISWKEFKKMAPPIIKLESNRIDELIKTVQSGSDVYNALIKTRYELKQFIQCLDHTENPPLSYSCTDRLSNAILSLSFENTGSNEKLMATLHYILERLNYVYNRIEMMY